MYKQVSEREREIERDIEREREREKEKKKERHREREIEREREKKKKRERERDDDGTPHKAVQPSQCWLSVSSSDSSGMSTTWCASRSGTSPCSSMRPGCWPLSAKWRAH